MKRVGAFFQLIRWPNLFFIALTQFLFYTCVLQPEFLRAGMVPLISWMEFMWICVSSVCIAAAGYIINDYFDLNIDLVNKPEKTVVEKVISRRWAMLWHMLLSLAGVGMGFLVHWSIGISNLVCAFLLWMYSTLFKKQLLIGNVLISLLTAWVVLVMGFRVWLTVMMNAGILETGSLNLPRIYRITFLYAGFAFIISLVREVIKDMEDMEGDARYGCTTMPIVWGVPVSKVFSAVWMTVLLGVLVAVQFYVVQFGWWWSALYVVLLIVLPLLWVLRQLVPASTPKQFRALSNMIKAVMFTGIVSMIFFRIYT